MVSAAPHQALLIYPQEFPPGSVQLGKETLTPTSKHGGFAQRLSPAGNVPV